MSRSVQTSLLTACLAAFLVPGGMALDPDEYQTPEVVVGTSASSSVSVFDFGFEDSTTATVVTTVSAGDSVTFEFDQGVHTATALDGSFDSGIRTPGDDDTYTVTFDEPGVFKYDCQVHPIVMHGVVVVSA